MANPIVDILNNATFTSGPIIYLRPPPGWSWGECFCYGVYDNSVYIAFVNANVSPVLLQLVQYDQNGNIVKIGQKIESTLLPEYENPQLIVSNFSPASGLLITTKGGATSYGWLTFEGYVPRIIDYGESPSQYAFSVANLLGYNANGIAWLDANGGYHVSDIAPGAGGFQYLGGYLVGLVNNFKPTQIVNLLTGASLDVSSFSYVNLATSFKTGCIFVNNAMTGFIYVDDDLSITDYTMVNSSEYSAKPTIINNPLGVLNSYGDIWLTATIGNTIYVGSSFVQMPTLSPGSYSVLNMNGLAAAYQYTQSFSIQTFNTILHEPFYSIPAANLQRNFIHNFSRAVPVQGGGKGLILPEKKSIVRVS